jgi:hypothetical protein
MSPKRVATTPEEWLKRLLAPPGFFLGLVLGFMACCVVGRQAVKLAPFHDIQRLHSQVNPDTLYHPTALQLRTFARQQLARDKIAVIVGGNSTFYGLGQAQSEIWTKYLQTELGDDFCVLNLAVCGGPPNGFGLAATEMLARDRARILYVCNCTPGFFTAAPDGAQKAYRYLFHDARSRGLLLPHPERDRAQAAAEAQRASPVADEEMHLQMSANRLMSFNDLWNVVGYEVVFTVWTANSQWQARKNCLDNILFQQGPRASDVEVRKVIRSMASTFTPGHWAQYEMQVRQSIPEQLRGQTLAVIVRVNPADLAVVEAESPGVQKQFAEKTQDSLAHLRACGLEAVEGCADLPEAGFVDYLHLNATGGAQLARELAPVIRDLARRRGYWEEGGH